MSIVHYFSPTYNEEEFDFSHYESYLKNNYLGKDIPFFISDWNSGQSVNHLKVIANHALESSITHIDHYFSCHENECREKIAGHLHKEHKIKININQITIGNNATSLINFCIQNLIFRGVQRYLAIAPIYFSAIDAISLGNGEVTIFQPSFPNLTFNIDELDKIIQKNNIQAIIITDPYFGFGKKIEICDFNQIITICRKNRCIMICDFARYGLDLNCETEPLLFNEKLDFFEETDRFAVIYSPCKKYFANGIKTAIMITSYDMCATVSDYADSVLGSISSSQIAFLNSILDESNFETLQANLQTNKRQIVANYERVVSYNLDSNIFTSKPDMGNYMVLGLEKKENDFNMFKLIARKHNIISLPLSLYHFFAQSKYLFRVNLLSNTAKLLDAVDDLQSV